MADLVKLTQYTAPTNVDYVWTNDILNTYNYVGPDEVIYIHQPRINRTPAWYTDRGIQALAVPQGGLSSTLPGSKRGLLTGRGFILDVVNKPFASWTQADAAAVAAHYYDLHPTEKFITGDMNEAAGGEAWENLVQYELNPSMWKYVQQKMGEGALARGLEWAGDYAGSVMTNTRPSASVAAALASPATALAYLKSTAIDGGMYTLCPYWYENIYDLPGCNATIINCYFRASTDNRARLFELFSQVALGTLARTATGKDIKLYSYTEGVDNEFTEYTHFYRRNVPAGGHVIGLGWPGISWSYLLMQDFFLMMTMDRIYDFGPASLYGTDPNVVPRGFVQDDGTQWTRYFDDGSGQNLQLSADTAFLSDTPVAQAGYPSVPQGFNNSKVVGGAMAKLARDTVGSRSWYYPSITINGNTASPSSPTSHQFLKTILDSSILPYAMMGVHPTNGKGWVVAYNASQGVVNATFQAAGMVTPSIRLRPGQFYYSTFEPA